MNSRESSAKLFCGLLYREADVLRQAMTALGEKYGAIEFTTEETRFEHTDYYAPEMGNSLNRRFISFEPLVMADCLRAVKLGTGEAENRFRNQAGKRRINIDPGLITLANLQLASTKDFSHRIYLGEGIFGEVSLIYEQGKFVPLRWTYPDYCEPDTLLFFARVRDSLKNSLGKSPQAIAAALQSKYKD